MGSSEEDGSWHIMINDSCIKYDSCSFVLNEGRYNYVCEISRCVTYDGIQSMKGPGKEKWIEADMGPFYILAYAWWQSRYLQRLQGIAFETCLYYKGYWRL